MMKKILLFLTFFLFIFEVKAEPNYYLLGLGDSITTGYGLNNSNDSYINLFKDYLTHYHSNITFNNEAINGLTSKQLLNNIKNNINLQNKIKSADIIVMSIGGNDYLQKIIYNQNPEIYINVGEQLLINLKNIYDSIFYLNDNVILIVIPLYNPYLSLLKNNQELLKIYNQTKKDFIKQINDYQTTYNKKIYTSDTLSQKIEIDNNLNPGIDPHPNLNGHKLIAEECIKIFNDNIFNNIKKEEKSINFFIKYKNYFIVIGVIIIAYLLKNSYNKAKKR